MPNSQIGITGTGVAGVGGAEQSVGVTELVPLLMAAPGQPVVPAK